MDLFFIKRLPSSMFDKFEGKMSKAFQPEDVVFYFEG